MIKHNFCANTFADLIIALKSIGKLLMPIYKFLLLPIFKLIGALYLLPVNFTLKHTTDNKYNLKNINMEVLVLFVIFGESVGLFELFILSIKLFSNSIYSLVYTDSLTFFSIIAQCLIGFWIVQMIILVIIPVICRSILFISKYYNRHLSQHFKSLKVNTRDAILQKKYK